jgi:caffeoyl-CoA O-methyltransferase
MDILAPEISAYLDALVPARPPEMQAMERRAAETGFPIIGPAAGQLCYLVARMIGARRVFELGSGYGYSTAWFARAVRENGGGEVHHVVWDEELSREARGHLAALGYDDLVRFHVGEAVATLREMPGPFDLVFNDIEKSGYPAALPVIAARLRPGGALIVDNLLWSGRVLDPGDQSEDTKGVRGLTQSIMESGEWISSIAPIRDGVLVALKQITIAPPIATTSSTRATT